MTGEVIVMNQTEEFEKVVESVLGGEGHEGAVIFVTGKPGSGKSKVLREAAEDKKWEYVDCRNLISEEFLAVPREERKEKAPGMLADTLRGYHSEVLLLDRLQTLFVPVFNLDVKAVLEELAKEFVIVAAWPGRVEDDQLCYDKFDGSASIRIPVEDFILWNVE